ncbi:MAG TPA: TetR/AcrR family transcriptional regulator [Conexibacter sp.]
MPRVKQRTNELRERGVATALAVLAEEGVAGLTTRNVARRAKASVPAVYEVFGDKAGLIREVFFQGFRMLGDALAELPPTDDPIEGLERAAEGYRAFVVANPVLAQVMFSRPFADFDPTTAEEKAGVKVREIFVDRVRVAVDAGVIAGDPTDVALVFFGLLEGLTAAENARRLGSSRASVDRRWSIGVRALLAGLKP